MTSELLNGAIIRSIPWVDRLAISISTLCIIHCLFSPLLLLALPVLMPTFLGGETLHFWLVLAIIPSSIFALGMGCKQHKRTQFLFLGFIGLSFLLLGIASEVLGLEHIWERIFTVAGGMLMGLAHVRNFKLCRDTTDCSC